MTLIEFQDKFGTEEQCREYLYEKRWPEGFVCPKCGHKEYFNIKSRGLYQCKACNHQASLTAGTVMDKTQTPLRKWFLAMYLYTLDKRGVSALILQKELGIAYYTAWTMGHKIRAAMGERDKNYALNGIVELDEAFFGAPAEDGKRGRGTEKTAVLVSVSLSESGKPEFVKMKVVEADEGEAVDGETVKKFAEANIKKGSDVRTDGLNIYSCLTENGYSLVQKKYAPKKDAEHLHWTHIVISNAKAFIEGTFHGLDKLHLQRYLDEFCYRFNRRWFVGGFFANLLHACILRGTVRGYEVIG